ncbi:MAG: glutaredoxin family protein [Patescibacteria group bacterium]
MKKILVSIIVFFSLIWCAAPGKASAVESAEPSKTVEILMFVQQGCPHCAKTEEKLKEWQAGDYPEIDVKRFDILESKDNLQLFLDAQQAYGIQSSGVPTLYIGEQTIIGERYDEIEAAIKKCQAQYCPAPTDIINNYLDRQHSATTASIDNVSAQSNAAARQVIVLAIVIIAAVCGFMVYRIIKQKKNV